jgi:rare lipoprotein A
MEQLTAAHRTLPFGTWVRVLNLDNSKTVDVRINDRGPFVDGRIIDLSRAAARAIDMLGPGIAWVRIEVINAPENLPGEFYAVQVGAFRDLSNARRLRDEMEHSYGPVTLLESEDDPIRWRVVVGERLSADQAAALRDAIRRQDGEAFVVRIDIP